MKLGGQLDHYVVLPQKQSHASRSETGSSDHFSRAKAAAMFDLMGKQGVTQLPKTTEVAGRWNPLVTFGGEKVEST